MSRTEIDLQIAIPPQTRYIRLVGRIAELLVHEIREYSGDRELLGYHLNLVLSEALANAILHARTARPCDLLRVCIHVEGQHLCIKVFDHGVGFDISRVQPPDFNALDEGGRGIFIIRELMDSVSYQQQNGGNCLEMHRDLTKPKPC